MLGPWIVERENVFRYKPWHIVQGLEATNQMYTYKMNGSCYTSEKVKNRMCDITGRFVYIKNTHTQKHFAGTHINKKAHSKPIRVVAYEVTGTKDKGN